MPRMKRREGPGEEPLKLLIEPDGSERARSLEDFVRFFRILAADVSGLEEQAAILDSDLAQQELDRASQRRVHEGLESLLRHYLCWHLEGRSFLYLEAPSLAVSDAWRLLTEELEGVAL